MDKFAPHLQLSKAKMPSASGGFAPYPLTRDSVPGPRWRLRPQTPLMARAPRSAWVPQNYEEVYAHGYERILVDNVVFEGGGSFKRKFQVEGGSFIGSSTTVGVKKTI